MVSDRAGHAVLTTTVSDREQANGLARMLINQRLVACVQLMPVDSVYRWHGRLETASEILLLIKTRADLTESVISAIKAAHPYETPEILVLPVAGGLPAYLSWIEAETQG